MYFKLLGGGIAILIVYLGYSFITGIIADNATLKTNIGKLKLANKGLTAEKVKLKKDLKTNKAELGILNDKITASTTVKNTTIKLFSDHKFTNLFNKKSGLLIRKMNRATDKVFIAIEKESGNAQ